MERGIIPSIVGRGAPFPVGPHRINFLQLSVQAARFPAEAKGYVGNVQAKVIHDAGFATELILAFPINGLGGIEIAGVEKAAANREQRTERASPRDGDGALGPG